LKISFSEISNNEEFKALEPTQKNGKRRKLFFLMSSINT